LGSGTARGKFAPQVGQKVPNQEKKASEINFFSKARSKEKARCQN